MMWISWCTSRDFVYIGLSLSLSHHCFSMPVDLEDQWWFDLTSYLSSVPRMYLKSSEWIVGYLGRVTWPCQCLGFNLSHPVLRTLFFYSTGDFSEDWDWIVLPFQGLGMGLVYCTWPIPHFHWHSEQIPLLSKGFTGNPLSSSQIFVCVRVCVYLFNVYFFLVDYDSQGQAVSFFCSISYAQHRDHRKWDLLEVMPLIFPVHHVLHTQWFRVLENSKSALLLPNFLFCYPTPVSLCP